MTTTQTTPIAVECDECLQPISEDVRLRWWNGETFSRSLCRTDAEKLVDTDQAEIIGFEPYHFRDHTMTATKDEYRQIWIDALRSGRFAQTTGGLRDDTGFCCLGVAADILGGGWWGNRDSGRYDYHTDDGWKCIGNLPPTLRDELGLTDNDVRQLTNMNDFEGKTFEEIADYIEALT